jgi:hypothetical protein
VVPLSASHILIYLSDPPVIALFSVFAKMQAFIVSLCPFKVCKILMGLPLRILAFFSRLQAMNTSLY